LHGAGDSQPISGSPADFGRVMKISFRFIQVVRLRRNTPKAIIASTAFSENGSRIGFLERLFWPGISVYREPEGDINSQALRQPGRVNLPGVFHCF
jgi:hypothetical protein